jgi:ribonucleoside-diphosphate reductase alpha subunit
MPGDEVVAGDGSVVRVRSVHHYPLDDHTEFYGIFTEHSIETVIVAGCHPILAFRGCEKARERLTNGTIKPEYIDVEKMMEPGESWFVATPIPHFERDVPTITEEDCRMYGILLGSSQNGVVSDQRFRIYSGCFHSWSDTMNFVERYTTQRAITINLDNRHPQKSGVMWMSINPKTFPFTPEMFAGDKIAGFMLSLPVRKTDQIVRGLMECGYRSSYVFSTPFQELAHQIRFILLRAGVPTVGWCCSADPELCDHQRCYSNSVSCQLKGQYMVRIPKSEQTATMLGRAWDGKATEHNYILHDNKIWSPLQILKRCSDELRFDKIIDLEIDTDDEEKRSYMTEVCAAHNGGKRKGSGAIYLRDCHVDVCEFIELRDEGPEDLRAKDLFLALMISDLFMKRVELDQPWSLFCPNKTKSYELFDKWGADFEMAYLAAEARGLASKKIRARELWTNILTMQIKKGMPFILYMDACNRKSNQKHSGVIRCSNLCTEILEVTSPTEIASCTLASVSLNRCVENNAIKGPFFNFDKLERLVAELVQNLNQVIDRNFYPKEIPEIRFSNLRHRPLGIGVQGLADTFALLDYVWVDDGTGQPTENIRRLNDQIFETIYFAAIRESIELAKIHGHYETFPGSPASKGLFQFDMWESERLEKEIGESNITIDLLKKHNLTRNRKRLSRYTDSQWEALRRDMVKYGLRNSLLVALMPTASSAHILGNNECMEPFAELISARTVLSGQFLLVNKHLVRDLREIGLWCTETVRSIIANRGSIQSLELPADIALATRVAHLKNKYRTVFEIPQKVLLTLAIDRARFVCQTQSMNCFMARPTKAMLHAFHFYGWSHGIKTGMYYLRQKALTDPINFTLDDVRIPERRGKATTTKVVCNDEVCLSCQS